MAGTIIDYTKKGAGLANGKLGDVKGLVIHHTVSRSSVDAQIDALQKSGYGSQFIMDRDGTVYQTVPDGTRTNHVKGLNSNYIGLEVIAMNDGDITQAQTDAIKGFSEQALSRYGLKPSPKTVFGHKDLPGQSKQLQEGQTLKWVALTQFGFEPPKGKKLFGDNGKGQPAYTWEEVAGTKRRPLVDIPTAYAETPFGAAVDKVRSGGNTREGFVNSIYQASLKAGMSEAAARVTAAQAGHESQFGEKAVGYNYFGIKGQKGQWDGPVDNRLTWEGSGANAKQVKQPFRVYSSPEEAIADRVKFMADHFPGFAKAGTVDTALAALRTGSYGPNGNDGLYYTDDQGKYESAIRKYNDQYLGGGDTAVGTKLDTQQLGYTVQKGDTLGKIASRMGTTVEALAAINNIADPNKVSIGQNLKVPGGTSAAPTPATMSPALQAARARLSAARVVPKASSISDPLGVGAAGLSTTPRLPNSNSAADLAAAKAKIPAMSTSNVQERAIIQDEGMGALLNPRSPNPATPNPVKAPVPGLRIPTGATIDPVGAGAKFSDLASMQRGVPAAPVAKVPATLPPVPLPRDARPATPAAATETKQPAATPAAQPKMVTLDSGKTAKVGDTAVIGGKLWTVTETGNGKGKLVKTDPGILSEIDKPTVAGGIVREKVGEAITSGKEAAVAASKPVIDTVAKTAGDLFGQAGSFVGGLFGGGATLGKPDTGIGVKVSVPISQPKPLTFPAVAQPGSGATLAAPGAGLSAAQRNAMTSLTGTGMMNGAPIVPPIPATMSPGLRTAALPKNNPIVVARPKTSTPTSAPAQPKLYQAAGYVYVANPSGGYTKVGKVSQSSGGQTAVKTALSTSPTSRSSTAGLRPGDRTYNADTNSWDVK